MKRFFIKIATILFSFVLLCSCTACFNSNEETTNIIPQDSISYTSLEFGNVIYEGKQAVFLNFNSAYPVIKIEIEGVLLDKNGNTIYTFDTTMNFGSPSNNPDVPIRIDANLIKSVKSASFTKIKGYTKEEIS